MRVPDAKSRERSSNPRGAALVLAAALACVVCGASGAAADLTVPGCATLPSHVNLVGASGGVADAGGEFTVTVRDYFTCGPWPNSLVVLDLSTAPDLELASDPVYATNIVDCPTHTIRTFADASGVARFRIVGGSTGAAGTSSPQTIKVYADGVMVGTMTAGAFDLDGSAGVGGADLGLWLDDFGSAANPGRADYDGDGQVGGADLALWITQFGNGSSSASGFPYCP